MKEKIRAISAKANAVMQKYPMVLAMGFLASVFMIMYVSFDYEHTQAQFQVLKAGIIASLGISLTFGLTMLASRTGRENLLQLAGIGLLFSYYFILPENQHQFTEVETFHLIPVFIASHLFVAFIPFLRQNSEAGFWQYNKNLLINFFLTIVFTGILTLGALLAIGAVDNLFNVNLNKDLYGYTVNFFFFFGSTVIFLLFCDRGLHGLENQGTYPQVLKFFTQYVLVPLLLLYSVILLIYGIKILINWELPRGWVSYLILAYSVTGLLAVLLVKPLEENHTRSWVRIFSKIFFYTLLPLLVLLFTAIFVRILEYGYTEPRYFVLVLAIWITAVTGYFLLKRKPSILFIPVSLFAFLILSLTVPYLNVFAVAKRSQKTELLKLLNDQKLLKEGKIDTEKKIPDYIANSIADKFMFLSMRKETQFLGSLISDKTRVALNTHIEKGQFYEARDLMRKEFKNIDYRVRSDNSRPLDLGFTALASSEQNVNISQYNYLLKAHNYKINTFDIDGKVLTLNLPASEFSELYIEYDGEKVNLVPSIAGMFKNFPDEGEFKSSSLYITLELGGCEFRISFDNIVRTNGSGEIKDSYMINSETVLILVKKK